ncbi:outer membrane protein assembly factor BamD [uncultured Desulfobacter sp.]|uniref:outer membrane protein assembly factor BamD n=1 Tax=uncultured Desulfobacter sp. TaxID=240139 RepID=UPI002AAACD43|nr:outer membrane protein assembly factor BamD [uncultured Desulfobacter sp.]
MLKWCILFGLFFMMVSCATLQKDWEDTGRKNTPEAYKVFLRKHPQSEFSENAKQQIEKLDWENTQRVNTPEAYKEFIRKHPKSEFIENIKENFEKIDWKDTQQRNSLDAYREFLRRHPQGEYSENAKQQIDKITDMIQAMDNTLLMMANKIAFKVEGLLYGREVVNAENLSLASCVFAREMNCFLDKPILSPTPHLAMHVTEPPEYYSKYHITHIVLSNGFIPVATAWRNIQSRTLQANYKIGGIASNQYDQILASALSGEDMKTLNEIRRIKGHCKEEINFK